MPLIKGYSSQTIAHNIKVELDAGKSRMQAEAIALDIARKAAAKAGKPEKGPGPAPSN